MIKKIDHFVITTKDIEKCIKFYEGLGFKSQVNESRAELYAGDFKLNVHYLNHELEPHATHVQTGSADFCFEIDEDIYEFKKRIEDNGYKVFLGVVGRTGVRGNMNSIYLYDIDGNLVEFSQYAHE